MSSKQKLLDKDALVCSYIASEERERPNGNCWDTKGWRADPMKPRDEGQSITGSDNGIMASCITCSR